MNTKHFFFYVNLSAGKHEPVLEKIREIFIGDSYEFTIHQSHEGEDTVKVIREAATHSDMIVVYGGDGSITEAAAALIGTTKPMAIIPGGTANVLSKELGIPQDTEAALRMIHDHNFQLKTIDTGLVNGKPFLLRINLGIMADMITDADPDLKHQIGQLAYGVSTLKSIREAETIEYTMNLDGNIVKACGVALTVTNSGSMGIGDLRMQPGISVSDGLLDVLVLKDAGFFSIMKAAGGSLFDKETDVVDHWTCKKVHIQLPHKQCYLCDDCEAEASEIDISIVPSSLTVAVPLTE